MSRRSSISDRHYTIRLLSSTRSVFRLACRLELNRVLFLIPFYTDDNTPDDVIKHLPLRIRTCVACHFSDVFTRLRDLNGINTAGVVGKILGRYSNKTLLN